MRAKGRTTPAAPIQKILLVSSPLHRALCIPDQFLIKGGCKPDGSGPIMRANACPKMAATSVKQSLCTIDTDGTNFRAVPLQTCGYFQVVERAPEGDEIIAVAQDKNKNLAFQRISMAHGDWKEIKTNEVGKDIRIGNAVLSPDNKHLAYEIYPSSTIQNRDIRISAQDGSLNETVVEQPADDWLLGWGDNSHILFTSDRTRSLGIWEQTIKQGKKGGEPRYLTGIAGRIRGLGVTRGGSFYYAESMGGGNDVYLAELDLKTGKTLKPPEKADPKVNGRSTTPFWPSDGEALGYLVNTGTAYNTLRLYSPKNKTAQRLLLLGPIWKRPAF
jgi:hypothetical protein